MSALNELIEAASAVLHAEHETARASHRRWNGQEWLWNDDVWRQADPEGFERIQRLRGALVIAERTYLGPAYHAFLIRRPKDTRAWPVIFETQEAAERYPNRVSEILQVHLREHE